MEFDEPFLGIRRLDVTDLSVSEFFFFNKVQNKVVSDFCIIPYSIINCLLFNTVFAI